MPDSIIVAGFDHGEQPIPAASRVGPLVVTGGVYGLDSATGKLPDDLEAQVELMFGHLERILAAAGGGLQDIAKMTFWVKTPEARAAINPKWLQVYPDPAHRPARHTQVNERLPANMLVQCDAIAFVKGA